jgi:dTDP-4-amino-4,6-dideoxygalactose transaminase
MDFIDLKAQQRKIKENIDVNIARVLAHGNYIMGPEVKELEKRLASYVGAKHAIGCASGTDALLMVLMAYRIGPGDAVFTTPFTFMATAEVISLLGATPIFVDIDPETYNIDPAKLERAIVALKSQDASRHPLPGAALQNGLIPRAVIPVDLFGLPAAYDALEQVAARDGLFVIEDAAQSFGAEYQGKKACAFGHVATTSFFPAKPLGAYGDGGMCFTDDDDFAEVLDSLRIHGKGEDKYDNIRLGINGRLDTLQAAILLAKFDIFPAEVKQRQEVARRYHELLARRSSLVTPRVPAGYQSVWAQYSVLAENQDKRSYFLEKLKAAGIPTAIYYPRPLHLQTAYHFLGHRPGDFPVSEDCARRIFSLPMHPYLQPEEQSLIADILTGE